MVIQTSSIFWGDNPEGIVPNIGAKWFLGYNSTLGWSGRKCKMCFLNYMNRAFKWIQKHYDSIMKWLRKFSLNWAASSNDRPCIYGLLVYDNLKIKMYRYIWAHQDSWVSNAPLMIFYTNFNQNLKSSK